MVDRRPALIGVRLGNRQGTIFQQWARNRVAIFFLLPTILLLLAVAFAPIVYAIWVSVHETFFLNTTKFAGLGHYLKFLQDPSGQANIVHSLVFTLGSLIMVLPFSMVLALVLNREIRFRALFRTLIVMPWIVSQIVTALLWSWLLNPQLGAINFFIRTWFGAPFDFLGQPHTAMPTLIVANVWRSYPYPMLLLLAALQMVPPELYEAARVDGANSWQRFWWITLPMIRNTLLIATIVVSLLYFNMITLPFVLTGGGPVGETYVLSLRIYHEAFDFYRVGFASAVAVYLFVFNVLFSLLYIKILRAESHY